MEEWEAKQARRKGRLVPIPYLGLPELGISSSSTFSCQSPTWNKSHTGARGWGPKHPPSPSCSTHCGLSPVVSLPMWPLLPMDAGAHPQSPGHSVATPPPEPRRRENCGEGMGAADQAGGAGGCGEWGEGADVPPPRPGGGSRDPAPSMTGFHNISIPNMPREFLPPSPTQQPALVSPPSPEASAQYKSALFPQGAGSSSRGPPGVGGKGERSQTLLAGL